MIDLAHIRLAARACAAARARAHLDGWDAEHERFEDTEVSAFRRDGELLIAYVGSNSRRDWRENFRFGQVRCRLVERGRVHRGFAEHYDRSVEWVMLQVMRALDRGDSISIYGHSLGGIVAKMAALEAYHLGASPTVVTFGAPRGFSPRASSYYDRLLGQRTTRVVSVDEHGRHDIVPRLLPRWSFAWLYRHVGAVLVAYPAPRAPEWGAAAWNALRGLVPGVWPWQINRIVEAVRTERGLHGLEVYLTNLGEVAR